MGYGCPPPLAGGGVAPSNADTRVITALLTTATEGGKWRRDEGRERGTVVPSAQRMDLQLGLKTVAGWVAEPQEHRGIVSKSFECRLKGQGATFVEAEAVDSPVSKKGLSEASGHDEPVQQVIIIQGYGDGEVAIDQTLEESAAATLQTLAMAGQVAEVLHITEDGQVIASGREVASAGAHLAGGSTQYVVLESGETREGLQAVARGGISAAGQSRIVSESSTALDALLSAVSEMGHQEEMQGEATVVHEVLTPEIAEAEQREAESDVKQEHDEVQVIQETGQEEMQEVLQLAASQMMREGLTQFIVNDEGTHYIVTELDNCTLQVEGSVYGEAGAGDGEVQQEEQQAAEEVVVYLD
ncbi:Zinc finger protein 407 [Collichthys lucidus]|uniref:Zinc finger protein 407 n=1 Tax=Collichthys lucidus TaxID=240159 RepID=A0A4U5V3C1_COLLU|nr:Zinc finger protein 407 [Collichthys lucidus]